VRGLAVLVFVGCRGSMGPEAVVHFPASAPLSVGFAGAPTSLFGSVEDPDFAGPFQQMADAGADQFFPLFLTSEADGEAQTTGHLSHFLSPTLLGFDDAFTCRGASDPYAAAEGRLRILFPGALLFQLQPIDSPVDRAVLTTHLTTQREECWDGHGEIISAFSSYDQPVLTYAVAQTQGRSAVDLDNISTAADVVHDVLNLPTVLIEGPRPSLFSESHLTSAQRVAVEERFEEGVARVAGMVDSFGFDVYPVPDLNLTEPGAYVQWARELSGDGRTMSVLQGFGYEQTTLGDVPGRLPTEGELRFMAFDSIAAGADELLWFGQSTLDLNVPSEAQLWDTLLTVTGDIAELRNVVTRPVVLFEQSDHHALRGHGDDNSMVLIVVNRLDADQTFTIQLDGAVSATTQMGRNGVVVEEVLTTTLASLSAAVFEIDFD
jgi:hypothetical protein